MNLEFQIYEAVEGYEDAGFDMENKDIVIVGETVLGNKNEEYYLVHIVDDEGLKLIGGCNIQESAYYIPKKGIKLKTDGICIDSYEFNIPYKYLTMKIIEEIQNLNDK